MSSIIENKTQICLGCGQEYEAHIGKVMGITIVFGRSYCRECSQKRLEAEERKEAETKAREITTRREQWRRECGIPLRFFQSRFDKFDQNVGGNILKIWRECGKYADGFSPKTPQHCQSLVLYSPNVWGVGKTYLGCAIAHAILDKWSGQTDGCPVYFISEPQLFMRIRATYNRQRGEGYAETEDDIYRKLTRVSLLILDDVGKEEVSDPRFVQRVLFALIDGRYQNMLPMVITSNLDSDGLARHLGGDRNNSASMERLVEMTGNVFWEITGSSYRDVSKRISQQSKTPK
jgi:DNA replication protein DnaC